MLSVDQAAPPKPVASLSKSSRVWAGGVKSSLRVNGQCSIANALRARRALCARALRVPLRERARSERALRARALCECCVRRCVLKRHCMNARRCMSVRHCVNARRCVSVHHYVSGHHCVNARRCVKRLLSPPLFWLFSLLRFLSGCFCLFPEAQAP